MEDKGERAILCVTPINIETNQTDLRNKKWGYLLTLVTLATTIGIAIPVGYNIGVINSPGEYMRNWCNTTITTRYNVNLTYGELQTLWSAIVSIFLVGGTIGSLGGAYIADRYGRKKSLLIVAALFIIGGIFFLFCRAASSVELLIIGRFIVGLASGLTTAILPMYLTELAPLMLRGTLGVFCGVGVTGGVVVGQIFSLRNIFGTELLWQYALSSYALLVIICFLPFYYFPESPKYLYMICGEREKAKRELLRLRQNDAIIVSNELIEMETHAGTQIKPKSLISVLCDPTLLLPLIIVFAFCGGQQLSGINAVFYYSVSIFKRAGLEEHDAELANLGAGFLNLITSLFSPLLMSKINRRFLMILSCSGSAVFLFALTFVIHYIEYYSWLPLACIACVFSYIVFFQLGLGPIPYFIGTELFDVAPRSAAMSLGSLSNWLCNFLVGMTFPSLQLAWGAYVFLPFTIACCLLATLTFIYLPETRGRHPTEIAPLISNGFRSRPVKSKQNS